MSRNILEVRELGVSYGGIKAVKGISFDVPEGEIVTLIGANGAGKSSTLRSIVGLVKPSEGSILLDGQESRDHTGPGGKTCFFRSDGPGKPEDGRIPSEG